MINGIIYRVVTGHGRGGGRTRAAARGPWAPTGDTFGGGLGGPRDSPTEPSRPSPGNTTPLEQPTIAYLYGAYPRFTSLARSL